MYKHHSSRFKVPSDDTVVWRYMEQWKFKAILENRELYMSPISGMGDEFEGRISPYLREKMKDVLRQTGESELAETFDNTADNSHFRESTYISSWNIGDRESYALWGIYTKGKKSIAIKSTVGNLKKAFETDSIYTQHIGQIEYHDGERYVFDGNMYHMALQKYDYYAFEKEIRVIGADYRPKGVGDPFNPEPFIKPKIDVNVLIDEIYLSPACKPKYKKKIETLLKKNAVSASVKNSGIRDEWLRKELSKPVKKKK